MRNQQARGEAIPRVVPRRGWGQSKPSQKGGQENGNPGEASEDGPYIANSWPSPNRAHKSNQKKKIIFGGGINTGAVGRCIRVARKISRRRRWGSDEKKGRWGVLGWGGVVGGGQG